MATKKTHPKKSTEVAPSKRKTTKKTPSKKTTGVEPRKRKTTKKTPSKKSEGVESSKRMTTKKTPSKKSKAVEPRKRTTTKKAPSKKSQVVESRKRKITEQPNAEVAAEKEKIIAEAEQEAKQILEQAELAIQREIQAAEDSLKREALDSAKKKAQESLTKETKESDQDHKDDEASDGLTNLGSTFSSLLKTPLLLGVHQMGLAKEIVKALGGISDLAPDKGDNRFRDTVWETNPVYRVLLQSYLAWKREIAFLIDDMELDPANTERLKFLAQWITDAMAPTNTLLGNPEAVRKAFDTGGMSLVKGLKNLLKDMAKNRGMPLQVDKKAFKLGENIATSPGNVVFRNEILEIIQYMPTTEEVHKRPVLMVPPHNNKYYIYDISPSKSLVKFCVGNGFQVFVASWRCAATGQKDWALDSYVQALEQAIDAACQITGSKDINIMSGCSGSFSVAALAGHLAARGEKKINSLTMLVSMLDTTGFRDTPFGLFISPEVLKATKIGAKMGINLEGRTMGYLFAALRPNDLIWDFWINNYLLGNDPMAFDLLYWSNDFSDMPAGLHSDFLEMAISNPLVKPGSLTVCGTAIDLKKVTCDVSAIGGISDHITPWQGCYRSMRLYGGKTEFILARSGHVQSLLSSPDYPNARYYLNDSTPEDPEAFLAGATEHPGSWWKPGSRWLAARSGGKKPAPKRVGSRKHPALEAAPGTYVHGTHG